MSAIDSSPTTVFAGSAKWKRAVCRRSPSANDSFHDLRDTRDSFSEERFFMHHSKTDRQFSQPAPRLANVPLFCGLAAVALGGLLYYFEEFGHGIYRDSPDPTIVQRTPASDPEPHASPAPAGEHRRKAAASKICRAVLRQNRFRRFLADQRPTPDSNASSKTALSWVGCPDCRADGSPSGRL
jgi:hypothetical protein